MVFHGEPALALTHLERVIAQYDPELHHSIAFIAGHDPGVMSLTWSSWALWWLGYPDQALKRSQEALALAQELDHPFTLCAALFVAGSLFHMLRREVQPAQEYSEAVMRLSIEEGFAIYQVWASIGLGWVQTQQGQVEEGIAQLRQVQVALQAMGSGTDLQQLLSWLGEAYGKMGQFEDGLGVLSEALDVAQSTGECYLESERHRVKGQLLLMQGDEADAEASFRRAIEIACQQGAKSWELRATVSLCRLWQKQGRSAEARPMLKEIYAWFTEGFDTPDLQEARALLEELS
jgi:predicted ATPase